MGTDKLQLFEEASRIQKKKQLEASLPHLFAFKPYKWTLDYWNSTNRMKFICAGNQVSKGEPLDREILTTKGWKTFEELEVGDEVFGQDGRPTNIIGFPWEGKDLFYLVTFDDGDSIVVSKDHDWICMGPEERFRKEYKDNRERSKTKGEYFTNPNYQKWQVRSTQEIYEHCYDGRIKDSAKNRYVIPMCEPVDLPEKDFPIDPYVVGLIIGNGSLAGHSKTICINLDDKKIINFLSNEGATIHARDDRHAQNLGLGFISQEINELELNTLSQYKKIPFQYLYGSISQRKALLAGLMDTDGTTQYGKGCYYSTSSKELAGQVKELANSLGCMAEVKKNHAGYKKEDGTYVECLDSYCVNIFSEFNPFRFSSRKELRWEKPKRYKHQRVIYSIEPIGCVEGRCISVDNESSTYLSGKDFIVTRNSSTQIRHCIDLATDPSKWKKFFPKRQPHTFWYIYPDGNKINEEFDQKWEREFMPRGMMRNHHQYGWSKLYHRANFVGIRFNTGVSVYFKSWRQDFQSSTIDACFVDEEIPFDKYDELSQRLNDADGIFSMVFTATIGQKEWYDVIELKGKHGEKFPNAFKVQVSMEYDCMEYADGTPTKFTREEIDRRKAKCSSEREINRRIHGRFVSDEGLAFPSFDRTKNVKLKSVTDKQWLFYGGVDIGTGGREGHPAAITISAIRPDYRYGKLYKFWRGNKYETTTTTDILNRYIEMTRGLFMTANFYDWHSKEFFLRTQSAGVPFLQADKARDFGFDLVNTLFRNQMYDIETDEHTDDLIFEIENLKATARKTSAEDDGIDSLRYSLSSIPWDFTGITNEIVLPTLEEKIIKINSRHENPYDPNKPEDDWGPDSYIDEYNELLGGF